MSLIKQLAKETAIYGISSILVRLLPFAVLTPYFTEIFKEGEYGIITDMYTNIAFLVVLFTYRMETTFFRFGSRESDFENTFSTTAWSLIFSTGFWLALFWLFLPNFTQAILKSTDYQDLVMLMLCIVGSDALTAIPFARLRLKKRPIRFAAIKSLNVIVNIISVFFFLEACPFLIEQGWSQLEFIYDTNNRISYVLWANLIASLFTLLVFLPMYGKLKWQFDWNLWGRMIKYTAPLVVVGVAGVVNQLSGNTFIKELASNDYSFNFQCEGIYGAVTKIAIFMTLYTQAFNYAAEPFFFNNANRSDAKQQYADIAKLFTIIGCIVFLGIWAYIDILKYFIDDKFHVGLPAVPILLLAFLCLGLYYNFSIWYKLTDQTKYGGYIAVGGSIITIALNFILIANPSIPCYISPAIAALACYIFMATAAYYIGQQKYPIPYNIKSIGFYLLLAVTFFGASYFLKMNTSWPFSILMLFNSAWLLLFVFIILRIERTFLLNVFSKT